MPKKVCEYKYDGEPIPPGPSILETADFYGMTKKELAVRTGRNVSQITSILQGDSPVTEDLALSLERVLGMSAKCLLRFEKQYQQQKSDWANKEKIQLGKIILKIPAVLESLPR